jgi:FG-GAP-like repeat
MKIPFALLALASFATAADPKAFPAISTTPPPLTGEWTKKQLTEHFWAEGACVADVNKDGKMDILSGPFWYAGPDFSKRHTIYQMEKDFVRKKDDGTEEKIPGFEGFLSGKNAYSNNFISYAYDCNGDGWSDYVVIGFPGKETFWWENPKGTDELWQRHTILDVTDNESPMFVDITGDGKPELLCMSGGFVGYAEADWSKPGEPWKFRAVSPKGAYQKFTHGVGYGDVNGDGRTDILESKGWWEQPAKSDGATPWPLHEAEFGAGGAQMYATDVNGDGKADIITSLAAHQYGLAWFEQTNEGGAQGWTRHMITGTKPGEGDTGIIFSQPHAIDLVDMNGDGLKDIVTGKRCWAHGPAGDPEPNAPHVVYWFELKREGGKAKYLPHIIDDNSGVGTQVMAADVNGDGKLDVVVGNKRGVFVHTRK